MKKNKKIIASLLALVLVIGASIFGTLAYLQDKSEEVKNTFTVGDVQIKLDEADVDVYGKKVSEDRVLGNEYKLIPGHSYIKDPTVTVEAGSEESYIRMLVTINNADQLDRIFAPVGVKLDAIFKGYDNNMWKIVNENPDAKDNARTYEFRYYETVNTLDGENKSLEPLFTSFIVPQEITNDDLKTLEEFEITVEAHAIQIDGFADEEKAWEAFES